MIDTVPLEFDEIPPGEMLERARAFAEAMHRRRSVRHFSSRPVPAELIRELVRAAASAPSGANKQPWRFIAVADPEIRHRIRMAAEEEERLFYGRRAPEAWLEDLEPLGTDASKPFLERAPWLIAVFALLHDDAGRKHYYVQESVGIACGFLLAAIQEAGLCALTHTPSPMGFLRRILDRPSNERPYLLIPVGYPAEGCEVPDIARKPIDRVLTLIQESSEAPGGA